MSILRDFSSEGYTLKNTGPQCHRGCNEPAFEDWTKPGASMRSHHTCEREPEKLLELLLTRIGSWTNARWDQWARYEAGDVAADELIAWLESRGVHPHRR